MEEHRIGVMYWNLFKRWLGGLWDGLFPRGLRRSSALPALVVVVLIGVPGLGYYLHTRGRFHALKSEIKGDAGNAEPAGPRPGGLDPVVLTRAQTPGGNVPEFRSVTLLPGLGMGVLQITAMVPERGEVGLLAGPSVEAMASGAWKGGPEETRGAIEAPWGGLLTGLLAPVGTSLRTTWRGRTIEAPTDVQGRASAYGGMLGGMAADDTQTEGRVQGPGAGATFKGTSFNERWASKTDVNVMVVLGARALDVTVTAKNVGDQPEPMGIGWHPRFAIVGGRREAVEVRLPRGEALEIGDRAKGLPSGKIVAAGAGLARFQGRGAALEESSVDETVANPKAALLDSGAEAEVRDAVSGVGLKMTAVSANVRAFRVVSPAGANYVGVGTQTNLDDPLGKEWEKAETAAIATLLPGQTVEWKVRLEIFSVAKK